MSGATFTLASKGVAVKARARTLKAGWAVLVASFTLCFLIPSLGLFDRAGFFAFYVLSLVSGIFALGVLLKHRFSPILSAVAATCTRMI